MTLGATQASGDGMRGIGIYDGTGPGEPGGLAFDLAQLVEALGMRGRGALESLALSFVRE